MINSSIIFKPASIFIVVTFLLSFSALTPIVSAADIDDQASLLKVFNTSDNSIEKRAIVQSLNSIVLQEGEKAPQWVSTLLGNALKDESPVVVAEAAKQIGRLGLSELNAELIVLFKEADIKFGASGYTHRVQYAVIGALGKIGTNEAKALVTGLLKNDNGTQMGMHLLAAIQDFNDPGFINDLKMYKDKMDSFVKTSKGRGDDPILYSRRLGYSQFATDIERTLVAKGGK